MSGATRDQVIRSRVEDTAAHLPGRLATLQPRERAGVLIMANVMLDLAARVWGAALRDDPATAPRNASDAALVALAAARDAVAEASTWTGGSDVPRLRQMLATDVVMLTIGFPRAPHTYRALGLAWRSLWGERLHLGEALLALRDWERATGVDALPPGADGRRQGDAQVLDMAASFPSFFRRKPLPQVG